MADQVPWPPISPHAALLSSPSGRRKYESRQIDGRQTSPVKRSATTPSLLERLRAVRAGNDHEFIHIHGSENHNAEEDEDEETLQLQLAAIEARLKLKKLQQTKAKTESASSTPRPTAMCHTSDTKKDSFRFAGHISRPPGLSESNNPVVEVALSPVKKYQEQQQQRSPGRVILGIDKGVRGFDVNLRRANTTAGNSLKARCTKNIVRDKQVVKSSRNHDSYHSRLTSPTRHLDNGRSFSERMSEARERDRMQSDNRSNTGKGRAKGFQLDEDEMKEYKWAAGQKAKESEPDLANKSQLLTSYSRDDVVLANEQAYFPKKVVKRSRTMPDLGQTFPQPRSKDEALLVEDNALDKTNTPDATLFEVFSQLHLSSRVLPYSFLKRTLPAERFTIYRIPDLLKIVTSPAYELPDSVADYVVFAVIASKSGALDHRSTRGEEGSVSENDWKKKWEDGTQNQKKFMALTLTDLKWTIDLYLFGTALPRYHRLSPGTVVAILNPSILPPKRGREDTGAFSLALSDGEDTVLEIGRAAHLGYCNVVKKDGKECQQWVDSSKTEVCEWHLNAQLQKTRSKRMGVNTGTNGFGDDKTKGSNYRSNNFDKGNHGSRQGENRFPLSSSKDGSRFDRDTGSQFYLTRSNPRNSVPELNHDPFVEEGSISRDKDNRLQKRLALQEKERQVAKKLTTFSSGGAGAEYMRHKVNGGSSQTQGSSKSDTGSLTSALSSRSNIMKPPPCSNQTKKRTAENVRLSPVKKTRFVTENGIREAGRESFGIGRGHHDEDDDLDIV